MTLARAFYAAQLRRLRDRSTPLRSLRRRPRRVLFEHLEPRLLLSADNELLAPLTEAVVEAAALVPDTSSSGQDPGATSGVESLDGAPVITIPAITASKGRTITVPISTDDGFGVESVDFELRYDPAFLTFVSVQAGSVITDTSAVPLANSSVPGTLMDPPEVSGAVLDADPSDPDLDPDPTDGQAQLTPPPSLPIYFSDVGIDIGSRVDLDGDGWAQQLDILFDVDAVAVGFYYVEVWEEDPTPGSDFFVTDSATFVVDGTQVDAQRVSVVTDFWWDEDEDDDLDPVLDGFQSRPEFRLDLYDAITGQLMESWRAADDSDLGGDKANLEYPEDDGFAPYFYDVLIANIVDTDGPDLDGDSVPDGDGYATQFEIWFDVDSLDPGQFYVRVYEDDGDPTRDDFLLQSDTFSVYFDDLDEDGVVDGFQDDFLGFDLGRLLTVPRVTIVTDLYPGTDRMSRGVADFRLDLHDAADDRLVQTWRPADHWWAPTEMLVELTTDVGGPYLYDVSVTNPVDIDGDWFARQFDLEIEVDAQGTGSWFALVSANGVPLFYTDPFDVTGEVDDPRIVTIVTDDDDVFAAPFVDLEVALYDGDTAAFIESWGPMSGSLEGVPVEFSFDDGLSFFDVFVDVVDLETADQDGDGFVRQFDVVFDVDSDGPRSYVVDIYHDQPDGTPDVFLVSGAFAVDGAVDDPHSLTVVVDEHASLPAHGTIDLRVVLYEERTTELVFAQELDATDLWTNLGGLDVESSANDSAFAPQFVDARIVNGVNVDAPIDLEMPRFDIEFDVTPAPDSAAAGMVYVTVFEHDGLVDDDPIATTAPFAVTPGVVTTQRVTIDLALDPWLANDDDAPPFGMPGLAQFRLVMYEDGTGIEQHAWGPANDTDLDDVPVEIPTDDNNPPVLTVPAGTQQATEGVPFTFQAIATDPDPGTTLTFRLEDIVAPLPQPFPTNATIDGNGVFRWTPGPGSAGTYGVVVVVGDGATEDHEDFEAVTIQVNPPPTTLAVTSFVQTPSGTGHGRGRRGRRM
ncbi:MAG: LEPR-XLL domain-containing protein [Candidatus Rokubacteria bacterium]|nr:LEPR-XLL domain-containing protein [Candidatus Rokubacteria bacterium]